MVNNMKNKKIEYLIDVFIQNGQSNDDCLHRPLFDVDIKMFRENRIFNEIIHRIVDYMKIILCTNFKDYGKLKGVSGANIGIPFNIVAILYDGLIETFINPSIVRVSRSKTTISSNCGSLKLPKSVKVDRHSWIQVKWMDIKGVSHKEYFTTVGIANYNILPIAATLQHEIDHNKGILITDCKKH